MIVSEILGEIKENTPTSIRFKITQNDIKNLNTFLTNRNYNKILYLYGLEFLLGIKHYYINKEQHDECELINEAIENSLSLN